MKIDFDGVTRVLDLQHVKLSHATAIQDFTGLAVFAWQEGLAGIGELSAADAVILEAEGVFGPAQMMKALRKMPMFTSPAWIKGMAAAHWLMLAQNGEEPPPLDEDYDCEVLGFAVAFLTALGNEAKARKVPDQPDPTVPPGRRAPSSRRTTSPRKPTAKAEAVPLPSPTGS